MPVQTNPNVQPMPGERVEPLPGGERVEPRRAGRREEPMPAGRQAGGFWSAGMYSNRVIAEFGITQAESID